MSWVDVTPSDWFYNEVTEASNIMLEDGEPFISGIGYGAFLNGAPYVYEEQEGVKGKTKFTINKKFIPTPANPLFVYVDGVQTMHKSATNPTETSTEVTMYSAPRPGAMVSFVMTGKVTTDRFGKPKEPDSWSGFAHPKHLLESGAAYVWDPLNRKYQEYLYAFGRPLKRIDIDDALWKASDHTALVRKYIGNRTDCYTVSPAPSAYIYLPYNLNGVTCKFTHLVFKNGSYQRRSYDIKATAGMQWRNDRFFPDALITRAEAFTLIDRLRRTFYSRFTDLEAPTSKLNQTIYAEEGQRRFKLNGTYPAGNGRIKVKRNGTLLEKDVNYVETNNHTITFVNPQAGGTRLDFQYEKTISTRFMDVGVKTAIYDQDTPETISVSGSEGPAYWVDPVLALEGETFQDGQYLIEGIQINRFYNNWPVVDNMYIPVSSGGAESEKKPYFMPMSLLDRAQAVAFLNRFRKWCLETFR
ncbi:hypothetical protein [Paenibacillus xylanexedens]|uniref:hypothetical protein n=1 Tax=Paenibacillus xylanexedens TaxID=528191 RepID=UPI0011A2800C|nr:hypothetical protein [Paenibacillus xylanexedens]